MILFALEKQTSYCNLLRPNYSQASRTGYKTVYSFKGLFHFNVIKIILISELQNINSA